MARFADTPPVAAPTVGSHFGVPAPPAPQHPQQFVPQQAAPAALAQPTPPPAAYHHPGPLTRREARERENQFAPDAAAPAPAHPAAAHETAALRPPSAAAPLLPEYTAERIAPTARVAPPPAPPVAATARARTKKPQRARIRTRDLAPRKKHTTSSKLMSLGALLFVGALIVGLSVPANAFIGTTPVAAVLAKPDVTPLQTVVVSADADPTSISHDGYDVVDYATLTQSEYGHLGTFTPTTGSIRWPFPYSVPISDGWGPRVAPCDGCSTFHQGVDFTPGAGTPIYAVADGVVEEHSGDSQYESFGNHVIIQHNIPGQNVESLYAHMITGSSTLQPGDHIKVGDFIGLVGETGSAVGAHLHFEIHIDKVPVDPYAWLVANATNTP